LGGAAEQFSYGLSIAKAVDSGEIGPAFSTFLQPNNTVLADIAADMRAFHVRSATQISPAAVLEVVKIAPIGSDGKYLADAVVVNVVDAPGGSLESPAVITSTLPQSAVAVSLVTARRGPTGKGRFYVPMSPQPLDQTTLLMSETARDNLKASTQTLINALNNQPGVDALDLKVVVASSKGYNTVVTGVRVGRVVDTIRSRRRSIPETFDAPLPVS
jgi:hypothetical protein